MYKSVRQIAFRDISKYIANNMYEVMDRHKDVWIVTPTRMYSEETIQLNRELGIHKLNMGRWKST